VWNGSSFCRPHEGRGHFAQVHTSRCKWALRCCWCMLFWCSCFLWVMVNVFVQKLFLQPLHACGIRESPWVLQKSRKYLQPRAHFSTSQLTCTPTTSAVAQCSECHCLQHAENILLTVICQSQAQEAWGSGHGRAWKYGINSDFHGRWANRILVGRTCVAGSKPGTLLQMYDIVARILKWNMPSVLWSFGS
jgi:hypothetical protein